MFAGELGIPTYRYVFHLSLTYRKEKCFGKKKNLICFMDSEATCFGSSDIYTAANVSWCSCDQWYRRTVQVFCYSASCGSMKRSSCAEYFFERTFIYFLTVDTMKELNSLSWFFQGFFALLCLFSFTLVDIDCPRKNYHPHIIFF